MKDKYFHEVIKHARISACVSKDLTSIKASQNSAEELARRAQKLEARLNAWYEQIDPGLKPQSLHLNKARSSGICGNHGIYLQFSYYGTLIAIHSIFAYPWNRMGGDDSNVSPEQKERSMNTMVDASRRIVLATKSISSQVPSPAWYDIHPPPLGFRTVTYSISHYNRLIFFYPLMALLNIFVHVLRYPLQASSADDIALMDIVAGHFGYWEYVSSSRLSFPYVAEIAALARATVQRAKAAKTQDSGPLSHVDNAGPHAATVGFNNIQELGEVRVAVQSSLGPSFAS